MTRPATGARPATTIGVEALGLTRTPAGTHATGAQITGIRVWSKTCAG